MIQNEQEICLEGLLKTPEGRAQLVSSVVETIKQGHRRRMDIDGLSKWAGRRFGDAYEQRTAEVLTLAAAKTNIKVVTGTNSWCEE